MEDRRSVDVASDPGTSAATRFPAGFLWGAATASHQVEGGNRWNDWWELEQSGRLPHRSDDACRHYELYESDFDLARSLGHNAHRFSIEWSRIEPRPGEWSDAALEHYAQVVDALRARGLEPIVTLHHFTNPAWLARAGGWTHHAAVDAFRRYVEFVATRLAGSVRFWLTINEPMVYVKHAYVTGDWPPCEPGSWVRAARALRNMSRAHATAYRLLHGLRADAMVGFAHSAPYIVPCRAAAVADRAAARMRDFALNGAWFRLLGSRPRDVLDFIGVNYYARQVVRWRPARGASLLFGTECRSDHHGEPRTFTSLGWEVCARGLPSVLGRLRRHGVPLMVTENGIATSDEEMRTRFLSDHVNALEEAVREGVPVLGYLYWTLMDNYEWIEGRNARFGLCDNDFATQRRTPRPAAIAFERLCKQTDREIEPGE
jgi:beta-glucosidase